MGQGFTKGMPIDFDETLSSNSDLLVSSQKAVKAYVNSGLSSKQTQIDEKQPLPGSRLYTSVSLAVNTARKPSVTKDVIVILTPRLTAGIGGTSRVNFQVDDSGGGTYTTISFAENTNALTITLGLLGGTSSQVQPITVKVPKGSNYRYTTSGTVVIESIYELTEW